MGTVLPASLLCFWLADFDSGWLEVWVIYAESNRRRSAKATAAFELSTVNSQL